MNLDELKTRLNQMEPEELRQFILETRRSRRIRKEPAKVKKQKAKSADKAAMNMQDLVNQMTPAEVEALLKRMSDAT